SIANFGITCVGCLSTKYSCFPVGSVTISRSYLVGVLAYAALSSVARKKPTLFKERYRDSLQKRGKKGREASILSLIESPSEFANGNAKKVSHINSPRSAGDAGLGVGQRSRRVTH